MRVSDSPGVMECPVKVLYRSGVENKCLAHMRKCTRSLHKLIRLLLYAGYRGGMLEILVKLRDI